MLELTSAARDTERMGDLPSVSIIVPTLNARSVLGRCLASIRGQDYPQHLLEIIVADGGSSDSTLDVARAHGAEIHANPLRTGEAGKAVGLRHAKGELVALIDSDNILPERDWFRKMVEPFRDEEILGSEPWEFTLRAEDGFITRYCALLGMNDPLCLFLGNYDRLSTLTGKWTGLPVKVEDRANWLKVTLQDGVIPTIGANGTLFRRRVLADSDMVGDYLFDIDVIAQICRSRTVHFAKVKTGIIHLYCDSSIRLFIRKQRRRVTDFRYYQRLDLRSYPWKKTTKWGILKFALACLTVAPLISQALVGFRRKPDPAWFFHPLACWLTLCTYGSATITGRFFNGIESREGWRQ